jgi:hypothetical protein
MIQGKLMNYGLNMKCPPQAYVLNNWSRAVGTILGGGGIFKKVRLS